MRLRLIFCAALLAATSIACGTPPEDRETISRWLRAHTGYAGMNVQGVWKAKEWGSTYLRQCGSTVTGKLGDYSIYGRIRGTVLYLSIWSNGQQYYTARLVLEPKNALVGKYYRTTRQVEGWPMMLSR